MINRTSHSIMLAEYVFFHCTRVRNVRLMEVPQGLRTAEMGFDV